MLDIHLIRERSAFVKAELAKVGFDPAAIDGVLASDTRRRAVIQEVESLRAHRAEVSRTIGKQDPAARQRLVTDMRAVGDHIAALEQDLARAEEEFTRQMLEVPNLPDPSVPVGPDERQNVVIRSAGELRQFTFPPRPHWEIGPDLGILDFDRGVKISGSRFYVLRGAGARLQRALISWMLDLHTCEHGYTEVYPPYLVKKDCLYGAGKHRAITCGFHKGYGDRAGHGNICRWTSGEHTEEGATNYACLGWPSPDSADGP